MKTSKHLFHNSQKDCSPGDGGRGGENKELHRVGAGELSASTITDTYTSFATSSTKKWTLQKYEDQNLVETFSKFAIFFM